RDLLSFPTRRSSDLKQAALLGSRGIAFSTNVSDSREPDFAALESYVVRVFELLLPIKTVSLVNVNLPEKPKGIRWTRQSVRHYEDRKSTRLNSSHEW